MLNATLVMSSRTTLHSRSFVERGSLAYSARPRQRWGQRGAWGGSSAGRALTTGQVGREAGAEDAAEHDVEDLWVIRDLVS